MATSKVKKCTKTIGVLSTEIIWLRESRGVEVNKADFMVASGGDTG